MKRDRLGSRLDAELLERAEREAEALRLDGPRPPPQPGMVVYARRQRNRFGDVTVWIRARPRR